MLLSRPVCISNHSASCVALQVTIRVGTRGLTGWVAALSNADALLPSLFCGKYVVMAVKRSNAGYRLSRLKHVQTTLWFGPGGETRRPTGASANCRRNVCDCSTTNGSGVYHLRRHHAINNRTPRLQQFAPGSRSSVAGLLLLAAVLGRNGEVRPVGRKHRPAWRLNSACEYDDAAGSRWWLRC
jgi:hypothetical protein